MPLDAFDSLEREIRIPVEGRRISERESSVYEGHGHHETY
jgi:hypothetical protein